MAAPAAAATDTAGTAGHIGAGLPGTAHDETSGAAAALGTSPSLPTASGTTGRMSVARGASTNVRSINDVMLCAVLCCAVLCCAVLCCAVLCCATRALLLRLLDFSGSAAIGWLCHLAEWRRKP
jgi:hypothetical protein